VDWGNSEYGPCGEPAVHNNMCIECLRRAQRACRKQIMELRVKLHTAEEDYKKLTKEIELT
jgi:hypothetical protein